eukprot:Sspe_Gene.47749::Locus_24505_Transcript_2_2_Confidence_0.286_Length_1426::g.47749::m.47749
MQGWRKAMEDAHCVLLETRPGTSIIGVFDGHCGMEASTFASTKLPEHILSELASASDEGRLDNAALRRVMCRAFVAADKASQTSVVGSAGSTAVSLTVLSGKMVCAFAGDCRAVLCRKESAVPLSHDHKPDQELESARIRASGNTVSSNGRINGRLGVSRGIGDAPFKKSEGGPEHQAVTAVPDVTVSEILPEDSFVVLGCDGIWERMSDTEVVEYVLQRMPEEGDLSAICAEICDKCLATSVPGKGCDNMTIAIVQFLRHEPVQPPFVTETTSPDLLSLWSDLHHTGVEYRLAGCT